MAGALMPVMSARGGRRRLGARRRRWRAPAPRGRDAARRRGFGRLDPARRRLDRVEAAAVAGDDAVELGQRLDLVDDHAAHLGGAVGGLLRQFENALAQLAARGLELVLHLGGHVLEPVEHLGEALGRLREHRVRPLGDLVEHLVRLVGRLLVDAAHGIRQCCLRSSSALLRMVSKFSAIARAPPVVEFGDQAGDLARALRRALQRLVEHAGRSA